MLLLVCASIFVVAEAQNSEIFRKIHECDSLKTLLVEQTLTERQQMEIYAQITKRYANVAPDSVIVYAAKVVTLAEHLGDSDSIYIATLHILTEACLACRLYPEAESAALKIWRTDSTGISESRIAAANIALSNIHMHNADKAACYFGKSVEQSDRYTEQSFHATMAELSIEYDIEQNELRILSMKRQQFVFTIIGVTGFALSIAILIFLKFYLRRARAKNTLVAAHAVVEGENDERERATRDINRNLFALIAATKTELAIIPNCPPRFGDKLDECVAEIYRVLAGIRPALLSRHGIKVALENYCGGFPNVQFCFDGEAKHIDEKMEDAIYYCACELVNNSIKHADATLINVRLTQNDERIALNVHDNGRGFDIENVVEGLGLRNINHRATTFNGAVTIASSPDAGTDTNIEFQIQNIATA
jgi:hypothetical protein